MLLAKHEDIREEVNKLVNLIAEEIEDRELVASISQDLAEKFKKYRELVQERKLKEAKSRKEPEVYHHFKKREN